MLVVAAVVFGLLFVRTYREPSSSMEPTLHCARPGVGCEASHDDRFAVLKIGGWGRGDIVVFHAPANACGGVGGTYVKRVIGLPGETVSERNGAISVDGRPLAELYIHAGRRDHETGRWHVPAGSYFLLGDNRAESCDSRVFGSIPRSRIIGRLFLVYWPPSRIGFR